jgi:hypothetical protein
LTHPLPTQIHTARVMLAVLLLTGATGISVQAESGGVITRTTPLTVTEKNQIVNGNFGDASNSVSVTDGLHDAVVDIPASVSGGTVQVKSSKIIGDFKAPDDAIMEANGAYIHGDYTGTVQFADGLHMSTTATGKKFYADCIYITGVENSYDRKGNITKEKTVKANEAYGKNGQIADAYGVVGKNTTLTLTGKPVDGEFINMAALESHFAHMKVGDGLNVSVTAGPAARLYISGLDVMYYGQMELGSGNTIKILADTGTKVQDAKLSAIYSSHDHPDNEDQLAALGRQKLDVGDDTNLVIDVTSSPENEGYIQNIGAFLSNADLQRKPERRIW